MKRNGSADYQEPRVEIRIGPDGQWEEIPVDMLYPVKCNYCGKSYDLTKTTPLQRYSDCTVYDAPCCGRRVDDRDGCTRIDK